MGRAGRGRGGGVGHWRRQDLKGPPAPGCRRGPTVYAAPGLLPRSISPVSEGRDAGTRTPAAAGALARTQARPLYLAT